MNKKQMTNKAISIHSILLYARKIRKIQSEQIDPFVKMIEQELLELYPTLLGKNSDGVEDWTCDILSESDDQGIRDVLDRIEKIENDRRIKQQQDKDPSSDDVINSILYRLNKLESTMYGDDKSHS
jgi:hypothetical protein